MVLEWRFLLFFRCGRTFIKSAWNSGTKNVDFAYTDLSDVISQNGFPENKRNFEMTKNENGYPKVSGCGCSQGTPDLMGATDRMNSVRQETNRMPEGSVGENGNGNSRGGCSGTGGCGGSGNCLDEKPLAYAYAPDQKFRML